MDSEGRNEMRNQTATHFPLSILEKFWLILLTHSMNNPLVDVCFPQLILLENQELEHCWALWLFQFPTSTDSSTDSTN